MIKARLRIPSSVSNLTKISLFIDSHMSKNLNSRRQSPPYWILLRMGYWATVTLVCTKFDENISSLTNRDMATNRNSRWPDGGRRHLEFYQKCNIAPQWHSILQTSKAIAEIHLFVFPRPPSSICFTQFWTVSDVFLDGINFLCLRFYGPFTWDWDIAILHLYIFGWKMPIRAHFYQF